MRTPLLSQTTIVHALRTQALLGPHAPVLFHHGLTLRYGELCQAAASLAVKLQSAGLAPGNRVGLLMMNSALHAMAYFGALWAGAVVVPLNTRTRAAELLTYLNHSEAGWLIASDDHPALPEIRKGIKHPLRFFDAATTGCLEAGRALLVKSRQSISLDRMPRPVPSSPRDWATLMYTSDTRGDPKGVMLSHGNLVENSWATNHYLRLKRADRTLCILPFHDAFGSSLLHTHVMAGASLILVNAPFFPRIWAAVMSGCRATGFSGVPSAFASLLDKVNLAEYDLSSIRYLAQAGAAMPARLIERTQAAFPQARLYIMYGQTEATARLSYLPPERLRDKLGSVGIPIPGVRLEIRDPYAHRLPPNTVGEVWAQGPNVMLGYWKDEALTRSVLRNGWLRTGDLGFLDQDGFLFLRGRATDSITAGGQSPSPKQLGEISTNSEDLAEVALATGIAGDPLGQVTRPASVARASPAPHPRDVIAPRRYPSHTRLCAYESTGIRQLRRLPMTTQ